MLGHSIKRTCLAFPPPNNPHRAILLWHLIKRPMTLSTRTVQATTVLHTRHPTSHLRAAMAAANYHPFSSAFPRHFNPPTHPPLSHHSLRFRHTLTPNPFLLERRLTLRCHTLRRPFMAMVLTERRTRLRYSRNLAATQYMFSCEFQLERVWASERIVGDRQSCSRYIRSADLFLPSSGFGSYEVIGRHLHCL